MTEARTLDEEARARAVETLAHRIAANLHLMLARLRVTVTELKYRLVEMDAADAASRVDDILAAISPHKTNLGHLAEIALALGCEWDVEIVALENPAGTMIGDRDSGAPGAMPETNPAPGKE